MKKFNPGVYRSILKIRKAYAFDIGCLLVRIYMYMGTLGIVSMLTLSGQSTFIAGTVASMLSLSTFFITPRMGKIMDEQGQHRVIKITSLITLAGIALLLTTVALGLPAWLMYPAAFLMGFIPSAPAIARTRWTFLLETGQLGENPPELKSIYSYEGVLEDCAFMIGPALSISLSSTFFPIAGILLGAVCFALGVGVLLVIAKDTEPVLGWQKHGETAGQVNVSPESNSSIKHRIVLRDVPIVLLLFCFTLLIGFFFGAFDTTSITFAQSIGNPNVASIGVSVASFISMLAGFIFGMLSFRSGYDKQIAIAAVLVGIGYGGMAFINSAPSFYFISYFGALFYAPCIITINTFCEHVVPANRLTESLTWVSAGSLCGLAISPTISGALIDALGATAGFKLGAIACVLLIMLAVVFRPHLTRALKQENARRQKAE